MFTIHLKYSSLNVRSSVSGNWFCVFETVYREHKKLDMCMVRCTVSTGHLDSVTMLMNKKIPIGKSIRSGRQAVFHWCVLFEENLFSDKPCNLTKLDQRYVKFVIVICFPTKHRTSYELA